MNTAMTDDARAPKVPRLTVDAADAATGAWFDKLAPEQKAALLPEGVGPCALVLAEVDGKRVYLVADVQAFIDSGKDEKGDDEKVTP